MARPKRTAISNMTIDLDELHSEAEVIKWYMPVIDALLILHGEATKKDAINKIIELNNITDQDLARTIKSGESALIRRIEFARNDLRVEGLIDGSVRGIWKLTELGKRIVVTDELARKIRAKSIRISNVLRKNKKLKEKLPIPQIDLSTYYRFRTDNKFDKTIDTQTIKTEQDADEALLYELVQSSFPIVSESFQYKGVPKRIENKIELHGRFTYPRSKLTAINALSLAKYRCEIDPDHPTFLRRHSACQYTEPHHLVPMAYQDQFEVSLDVEENIVSLCCVCHKQIHYGANADQLLKQLYFERKERLRSVGIIVTMEQILSMYASSVELNQ